MFFRWNFANNQVYANHCKTKESAKCTPPYLKVFKHKKPPSNESGKMILNYFFYTLCDFVIKT